MAVYERPRANQKRVISYPITATVRTAGHEFKPLLIRLRGKKCLPLLQAKRGFGSFCCVFRE